MKRDLPLYLVAGVLVLSFGVVFIAGRIYARVRGALS